MDFNFIVDFLIDYYGPIPYLAIFLILLACGLGLPVPEDITLIAGGILAYYGICDVWLMIALCLLGVLLGDSLVYYLGHHFGRRVLKKWPFRLIIDENKIESIKTRLHNHGGKLLFSARFMPGVRSTVFFAAGTLHYPFKNLLLYDGTAALISVPAIIYSVYYFGDILQSVIHWIKKVEGGIVGLLIAIAVFFAVKFWLKHRKKVKESA